MKRNIKKAQTDLADQTAIQPYFCNKKYSNTPHRHGQPFRDKIHQDEGRNPQFPSGDLDPTSNIVSQPGPVDVSTPDLSRIRASVSAKWRLKRKLLQHPSFREPTKPTPRNPFLRSRFGGRLYQIWSKIYLILIHIEYSFLRIFEDSTYPYSNSFTGKFL